LEKIKEILQSSEGDFINKERNYLNENLRFLESFWRATEDFVRTEEETVQRLQKEIATNRPEQERNEGLLNGLKTELAAIQARIEDSETELRNVATKRKEIVAAINPAELSTIKFKDNLDTSNDVFKWVIEAIYGDSKANYYWDNFKKNAFKKDKGADFIARLKGLNTQKMRKDNFVFGRDVASRSQAIIAELETKKKQNPSLRALFDYINNVVAAGDLQDRVELERGNLETKQNEITTNHTNSSNIIHTMKSLEDKVSVTTHYIETLKKLRPLFENAQAITQERIRFQEQYLQSLQGNTDALDNLVHSTSQLGQSPGAKLYTQEQAFNPVNEHATQQRPLESQTSEEGEVFGEKQSPAKEGFVAQEGEEQHFGGEAHIGGNTGKKVERQVPTTDLRESEFANSKKGGCETCNIF